MEAIDRINAVLLNFKIADVFSDKFDDLLSNCFETSGLKLIYRMNGISTPNSNTLKVKPDEGEKYFFEDYSDDKRSFIIHISKFDIRSIRIRISKGYTFKGIGLVEDKSILEDIPVFGIEVI